MRRVHLRPLTPEAFAPFGEVFAVPDTFERRYVEGRLANGRPAAKPSLSVTEIKPVALPFTATLMERHAFSSQSFVPMQDGRWIVMVAPHGPGGGPDEDRLEAFLAAPGQGLTYGMDVWHHPMTVLDRPQAFAITMWLERNAGDEEFHTLRMPVVISA